MCWVELHYGTVCFFFWRGEWANFDQFSAQPRNSQVEFLRILFRFKKRKKNSSSHVHVLHKTAN